MFKAPLVFTLVFVLVLAAACGRPRGGMPVLGVSDDTAEVHAPDLAEIEQAGELIATTVSGPTTYYEYRNRSMGLQFMLAEAFANSMGLRLRVEVAKDTVQMLQMLREAKADVIACELPAGLLADNSVEACGAASGSGSWAVRTTSPELRAALDDWYSEEVRVSVQERSVLQSGQNGFRSRHVQPVFSSKSKGVVSGYDALFLRASRITGWDWKLLASMCYQESGFDKDAVSWAGARGLMQIMPSTASGMGVNPGSLFDPETNVMTAAQIIKKHEQRFAAIKNPTERKKFVLAAYNGGFGHVDDAMNLARKYGKNPYVWNDVSYFIQHLSEPRYYRDEVVKYGYMVGNETFNYVSSVMSRWQGYHAVLHDAMPSGTGPSHHKSNRFSKEQNIAGRDDSLFLIRR